MDAVSAANGASSAGPTGWTFRLLKLCCSSTELQKSFPAFLARVINDLLKGTPPLPSFFTSSRLIALDKGNGKVRPIAVGEVFTRLAGKLALSQFPLSSFLSPKQFGVESAGGTEPILHGLAATQASYEEMVLVDVSNAFNTLKREAMDSFLVQHMPSLIPLYSLLYHSPSSLFLHTPSGITTLLSTTGVRQGCPLGTFLFSAALTPIIKMMQREFPSVTPWAYVDDMTFQLRSSSSYTPLITCLTAALAAIGLKVNAAKTQRIPNTTLLASGITLLGGHIGSPTSIDSFLSTTVDKAISSLSHLPSLPLQASLPLLRLSSIPKIAHIARLYPSAITTPYLTRWDTAIMTTLSTLLATPLTGTASAVARLPTRMGGAGFLSLSLRVKW